MVPSLRSALLGRHPSRFRTSLWVLQAVVLFAATFAAYALGFFGVEGGVVFVPGDAAIVGLGAACLAGYDRGGVVVGWVLAFAALLGVHADHVFVGLPSRTLAEQVVIFFSPDGLVYFAAEGLIIGLVGVALGRAARLAIDALRRVRVTDGAR